jgi:hypothetical protein
MGSRNPKVKTENGGNALYNALLDALRNRKADTSSATGSDIESAHPSICEIAALFFEKGHVTNESESLSQIAASDHCTIEIAEYARGQEISRTYKAESLGSIPPESWELIRNWENNVFTIPRGEGQIRDYHLLEKMMQLLKESDQDSFANFKNAITSNRQGAKPELVPVHIMDRHGELRNVELFENVSGKEGLHLKCAREPERFNGMQFHILLDFGEASPRIITDVISESTIRLADPIRNNCEPIRLGLFIIED